VRIISPFFPKIHTFRLPTYFGGFLGPVVSPGGQRQGKIQSDQLVGAEMLQGAAICCKMLRLAAPRRLVGLDLPQPGPWCSYLKLYCQD
jgi:hypothetical protein